MLFSTNIVARATALLLLAAAAPHAAAQRMYTKSSPVLQVDAKNWDKAIINSHLPSIVEFYAPWCGHCQNLKPAYEKAASSLSGIVQVAAVNCDEDSNKGLCGQLGIQGFPTIKTVRPAGLTNVNTGKDKDKDGKSKATNKKKKSGKPAIADYRGERSAKGIAEAAKALLPNLVARVTDSDVDEWLEANRASPRALLFSDKGTTSALLKSLALDFRGSLPIAQLRGDREDRAVDMFAVDTYPTLLVLPAGEEAGSSADKAVVYDGDMKKPDMLAFLKKYAEPVSSSSSSAKADSDAGTDKKSKKSKETPKPKPKSKASSKEAPPIVVSEEIDEWDDILESIEADSTPPSKPTDAAPPPALSTLATADELASKCLGSKTSTCMLVLLPADAGGDTAAEKEATFSLAKLSAKHAFPFYAVADAAGAGLRKGLGLEKSGADEPLLMAVNGKRKWVRRYDAANGFGVQALEAWVDGVKLGDVKKEKLPADLIVAAVESEEAADKHDEL